MLARPAAPARDSHHRPASGSMRIVSWNVNGLRACARKGFLRFLADSKADVLAVQEVRAFEHQTGAGRPRAGRMARGVLARGAAGLQRRRPLLSGNAHPG